MRKYVWPILGGTLAGTLFNLACTQGFENRAKAEKTLVLGSRLVIEYQASLQGDSFYIIRDKENGNLIYAVHEYGVFVQKDDAVTTGAEQ